MIADLRPIFLIVGLLIATLGGAMFLPAAVDFLADNDDWEVFAFTGSITLLVGLGLYSGARGTTTGMSTRQAFIMTTAVWVALVFFGSIPYLLSGAVPTFTDAFFESMSGLTTTGSTVITALDTQPPGILLWRGIQQWLGGLGIIVMAVAVLPMLQVGGMQLFKIEAFDTAEKIMPIAVTFMILGSIPFILYVQATRGQPQKLWQNSQVQVFFFAVTFCTIIAWLLNTPVEGADGTTRFVDALFNVTSVITGTGYTSTDYGQWAPGANAFFFAIMFIGGCAGSTSCGIKIFRFQILFETIKQHLRRIFYPNGIFIMRFNGKQIEDTAATAVMNLLFTVLVLFMPRFWRT